MARPTSSPLLGEGRGLAQLLLLLVIRKATIGNGRRGSRGGRECAHEACVSAEPTANTRTPRRSFRFKQRPRSNRRDPFSRRHLSLSLSVSRLEPVDTTIAHKKENKPKFSCGVLPRSSLPDIVRPTRAIDPYSPCDASASCSGSTSPASPPPAARVPAAVSAGHNPTRGAPGAAQGAWPPRTCGTPARRRSRPWRPQAEPSLSPGHPCARKSTPAAACSHRLPPSSLSRLVDGIPDPAADLLTPPPPPPPLPPSILTVAPLQPSTRSPRSPPWPRSRPPPSSGVASPTSWR